MIPWMGREPPGESSPAAVSFDFGVTDLEEKLLGAEGAQLRVDLVKRLGELDQFVASVMLTGIPPDEFQQGRIIRNALAHARKIVLALK